MKKNKKHYLLILSVLLLTGFAGCRRETKTGYIHLVNPFIGTGGHGHTYPGVSLPFGMVQLSPDTRTDSIRRVELPS